MRAARPTRSELAAARDGSVADLVGPGMRVLFVGINPGLASAATGHHFGNPANRLWATLHVAGFTPRRFVPSDAPKLLALGYGVTNLVHRATAAAAEVSDAELRAGVPALERTVARWRPGAVAFLGLGAYRTAYRRPRAVAGPQDQSLAERPVWLLPNPSGLNAHWSREAMAAEFGRLRVAAGLAAREACGPPPEEIRRAGVRRRAPPAHRRA